MINKACKAIKKYRGNVPGGRFLLVVDEADAMLRTKDGHQVFDLPIQRRQFLISILIHLFLSLSWNKVFEQALQQLLKLEPCMVSWVCYVTHTS